MLWRGYDSLMPDEHDLGRDWAKLPTHLPPAGRDLLIPFDFAPDRKPDRPIIVTPDGWIAEAREELRDGRAILCQLPVFGMDRDIAKCRLLCRGAKRHKAECPIQLTVRAVVVEFLKEMEARTRLRLAFVQGGPSPYAITYDDGDGVRRPEVRFMLCPQEASAPSNAALSPPG